MDPTVQAYAYGSTLIETIHIDDPGVAPGTLAQVSSEDALNIAITAAGTLANAKNPFSIQLASVTKDDYGPVDENGAVQRLIDHRLCWLVRFTGTLQPIYGPMNPQTGKALPMQAATELNVVIDAVDGSMLLTFSFQ